MRSKVFMFIASLGAVLLVLAHAKCNSRLVRHNELPAQSTVCVCSEEQKCDGEFEANSITVKKGSILAFESTKSGERFTPKSGYHFTREEPKESHLDGRVFVDSSRKLQKILGFGGAFTDSTGYNIANLSTDLQARLMEDYFGQSGIGYRVARVPIGGTDFSVRAYSLDDHVNDDTLERFALQPEDLNWKIPYIKMAQNLTGNQVKLFGSAWSAPAWMKTNHELMHGGSLIGLPGTKYYKLYARYLIRFLHEYQRQNVTGLWGLTTVNEPLHDYKTYSFNSLGMSGPIQRDFVRLDLGPALAEAGLGADKIKLMVYDESVMGNMTVPFVSAVLSDKETAKFVSGIAMHWYHNDHNGTAIYDLFAAEFPDKFILSTEACTLKPLELGNWDRAEAYAQDIVNDLNHHAVGWVEWNMVLDGQRGGPSWVHNNFDGSVAVNHTSGEYYKQPSFYAIGHFSKFVLPDSRRIAFDFSQDTADPNVLVTVLERPDGDKVSVAINRNSHPVRIQFHDPAQGYFIAEVKANAFETVLWN